MIVFPQRPLPFSESELEELSQAIRNNPNVGNPDGGYHLRNWLNLVDEIPNGYSGVYDEFINASWARLILEEALNRLNNLSLVKKIREFLAPYDALYMELTEPQLHNSVDTPIWISRIPKRSPLLDEEEFKYWRVK
jgi:hypothetical protein